MKILQDIGILIKTLIKEVNNMYISEAAMFRYKTLISRNLSFRNFSAQENEAISGINVINKMASLGMPKSYRVA
jgi:hypothetical protein